MKKNVVELDMQGNIKIPTEIRSRFKIAEGTSIEIQEEDKGLMLKKLNDKCIFCGSTEKVIEKIGKFVCTDCVAELRLRY